MLEWSTAPEESGPRAMARARAHGQGRSSYVASLVLEESVEIPSPYWRLLRARGARNTVQRSWGSQDTVTPPASLNVPMPWFRPAATKGTAPPPLTTEPSLA